MTHISLEVGRNLSNGIGTAGWVGPAGLAGARNLPWRRIAKFGIGAALLGVGALTTYQQVVVRVSREAVINARVASVRAPMDGIVKTATTTPGRAVQAGAPFGNIEDPMADDARVFQLQQDAQATERERNALSRRVADLQQARSEAEAQAEAYRVARKGTYLGDNYNDVPSSFQRARELTVRIDETQATLDQLARKDATLTAQLAAEQKRLAARSTAPLAAPIDGNLWTVQAASGEYVRKGQELFTVLDCSTVVVTASVSERDYNELRLGDPVRFRVAGSGREYSGSVSKLGLTSTGRSFAIAPEERRHQVAVQLAGLQDSDSDRCAVGRTGEVVFEGQGHGPVGRLVEGVRHLLGLA
jgi:multidrug resistance efflux pump